MILFIIALKLLDIKVDVLDLKTTKNKLILVLFLEGVK